MAENDTYANGRFREVETPKRKAMRLLDDACKSNSVAIMQQALAVASEHNTEIKVEHLIARALWMGVQAGSTSLLRYALSRGADVKIVPPSSVAWTWCKATDFEEKQEACSKIIKMLDILVDHGWDINTMQSVEYETTPLLWYVCGSQSLTRYCLDRGAHLIITGEQTSSNPTDTTADIYYTERHWLLLECAAAHGDVETFELLRSLEAPLVPGKSWPPWHAPCLLLRAVKQAAELAPNLQADATSAYHSRISMVKHLLSILGIISHESDPRTCRIVDSDFPPPEKGYWPNNYTYDDGDEDEEEEEEVADLQELVALLLMAHPNPEAFVHLDVDSHVFETGVTSLDFLKGTMPIPFQLAFKHWQKTYKSNDQSSKILSSSSIHTPQAAGVSRPSAPVADKLSKLPSEVINLIALHSKRADVLSFRGVNRRVRDASFAAFKRQIRCRKVSLTSSALERLHEELASSDEHLFWHVQEVVFQAEKDNSNRDTKESMHIQDLLTRYLIASKTKGNLRCLVLHDGYDALSCVFPALQRSELPLHKLSLFPEGGDTTPPIDDFQNLAGIKDMSSALRTLRHFTWTISTSDRATRASTSAENIATMQQIFGLMGRLESLDLGWYGRYPRKPEADFLDSCLDNLLLTMTRLKEIKLRAIPASAETLYKLVTQTTATRISLIYMTVPNGEVSFRPILDVLTSGRFDYFHLDDIHANERGHSQIRFIGSGTTRFISESGCLGPFDILRQGNEVRRHVEFKIDNGRILSSGEWQRYYMRFNRIYGRRG